MNKTAGTFLALILTLGFVLSGTVILRETIGSIQASTISIETDISSAKLAPMAPINNNGNANPNAAPGEIIIKMAPGTGPEDVTAVAARLGGSPKRKLLLPDYWLISTPTDRDPEQMIASLMTAPGVERAEPDYRRQAHFVPNDPLYRYQWHLDQIEMPQAWEISRGEGVVVAIVDSGIAYEDRGPFKRAPDLARTHFVEGYDFINNDSHPNDDHGHGTFLAGIIAQSTGNNLGVAGMAYEASIMPVKVLDFTGSGWDITVADGVVWAVDHGAKVINLSMGGTFPSGLLEDAIDYAYERGVVVVSSTGNGSGPVEYPAACDNCIAVGATRWDLNLAHYSSYGPEIDFVGPGGDLDLDQNEDGFPDGILQQTLDGRKPASFDYYRVEGTSMSAAEVSGLAALLVSAGVASSPDQIKAAMANSAKDLGETGWDQRFGYGLIQAFQALRYELPPTGNLNYKSYLPGVFKYSPAVR